MLQYVKDKDYDFESHKKLASMQKKSDSPITYVDTSNLEKVFGYNSSTSLRGEIRQFTGTLLVFIFIDGHYYGQPFAEERLLLLNRIIKNHIFMIQTAIK